MNLYTLQDIAGLMSVPVGKVVMAANRVQIENGLKFYGEVFTTSETQLIIEEINV